MRDLNIACDPRVRTEEEDGSDSRPFASGNLAVTVLLGACCE